MKGSCVYLCSFFLSFFLSFLSFSGSVFLLCQGTRLAESEWVAELGKASVSIYPHHYPHWATPHRHTHRVQSPISSPQDDTLTSGEVPACDYRQRRRTVQRCWGKVFNGAQEWQRLKYLLFILICNLLSKAKTCRFLQREIRTSHQHITPILRNCSLLKWNSCQNECIWVKASCKCIITTKEAPLRFTVSPFSGQTIFH